MTIKMMVAISCSLFRCFCNRVRASSCERRPIIPQAQCMSSRVTGRQHAAHQPHSFALLHVLTHGGCRFPPSPTPRSPWQRALASTETLFPDRFAPLQRAPEATARTRRRHRWSAAAASHPRATCDGVIFDAALRLRTDDSTPMPFGFDIPLIPARARSRRDLRC
jgi:hypothetical protein